MKSSALTDGLISLKIRPLARLGYYDYTVVDSIFEMVIPGDNEALLTGGRRCRKSF